MTDAVIPYGLYHHIDKNTGIYHSNIVSPVKVKNIDGTYKYEVPDTIDDKKYWNLVHIFYAVNPLFRPLPKGMKLFCAIKNKKFPYNIINLKLIYDVFDNSFEGTYFITYSTPVPNVKELYTWNNKNGYSFTDFFSHPPSNNGWTPTTINPIFVMIPQIMGSDYKKIRFMCNNGSCLPKPTDEWIEKSRKDKDVGWTGPDIYNPNIIHLDPLPLYKCVINCNELVRWDEGGGSPHNLINIIKRNQKSIPTKIVTNFSPLIISIILFIFIIILIFIVYQTKL